MLECQYGGTILALQHIGAIYWYRYDGTPSLQCHVDVISTLHASSFVIYSLAKKMSRLSRLTTTRLRCLDVIKSGMTDHQHVMNLRP